MDADQATPPPGRPLTPAQARLVQLIAEAAVGQFLAEQDVPLPDTPDDTEERE